MGNLFNIMVLNGGIADKIGKIIGGYVGPVFLVIVAGVSIMFVKEREFRKLAAFLGIAAIVGIIIFAGDQLFGDKGKISGTINSTLNGAKTGGN